MSKFQLGLASGGNGGQTGLHANGSESSSNGSNGSSKGANGSATGANGPGPARAVDRDAALAQLSRILANPLFTHSGRYTEFLRYVVEQTIQEAPERLKERTIGTAVFHRPADYDTNVDHVVRNVAVEVRKRLSQYYKESGRGKELVIQLAPGSYVPEFHIPVGEATLDVPVAAAEKFAEPVVARSVAPTRRAALKWAVIAVGVVAAGVLLFRAVLSPSAFDLFWAPVWSSGGPVVICVDGHGDAPTESNLGTPPALAEFDRTWGLMQFPDALTLARVAHLAGAKGKSFRPISGPSATYADLHGGPVILIGSGDGAWTRQLSSWLPYHLKFDGHVAAIVDSKNPNRTDYAVDMDRPYDQRIRDYAIVWRINGRLGDGVLTGAAGLTKFGVMAAADFLTSPSQIEDFARRAGPGWEEKNFEVLLTVTAIKGTTWPPLIIATELWDPGSSNAFTRELARKSATASGAAPQPLDPPQ